MRLTTAELGELYICHLPIQTFASQVIASAAHILIERRTQEDKP
jgi:hypothetical protein